jgi:hypothetical protein
VARYEAMRGSAVALFSPAFREQKFFRFFQEWKVARFIEIALEAGIVFRRQSVCSSRHDTRSQHEDHRVGAIRGRQFSLEFRQQNAADNRKIEARFEATIKLPFSQLNSNLGQGMCLQCA